LNKPKLLKQPEQVVRTQEAQVSTENTIHGSPSVAARNQDRKVVLGAILIIALVAVAILAVVLINAANKPQAGKWQAVSTFQLGPDEHLIKLAFKVNEAGNKLEEWVVVDSLTSQYALGMDVDIHDGAFEITWDGAAGMPDRMGSFTINGTFTASDELEGDCSFSVFTGTGIAIMESDLTGSPAPETAP
jgi:hypothetical protein